MPFKYEVDEDLVTPKEWVYTPQDASIAGHIGLAPAPK